MASGPAPAELTSARNPLLRDIRKAVQRGSLTADGFAVAESFHLLEEAIGANCEIKAVLAARSVQSTVERLVRGLNQRVIAIDDPLFHSVSSTEASQGVIALVRIPEWTIDQVFRGRSMAVILDGIQDPGNAGSILRAAEAFGATGAIFAKGSVHPYHPKMLRAAAGSIFRVPHVSGVEAELIVAALRQKRVAAFAAQPRGGQAVSDASLSRPFALVIGSEGRGVGKTLAEASLPIHVPTVSVESLNAAVAAGVILYEASRQRALP